ncbi:MAG: group II intron reverse transcriptase/maturase [Burkholderiales bacterium]|nr:group II intron reverse transcriptase/maturase [Burkholderiales bacterium]
MNPAKPFTIHKRQVWEAYKRVKVNQGGAGIDAQTLEDFAQDLGNNLYKLWNRMASGSYYPPPVKRVEIPKADGGIRPLGIPTVTDRIAQTVVKQVLEPELEKHFHPDSYGYRPGKSAHQALAITRKRCWSYQWVLEFDIKGYFDSIDHQLLMRVVSKHTQEKWVLLYIERWLKSPVQMVDGKMQARDQGTPQGGVISPLLANLYLHYTFDRWMQTNNPEIPFARFADDGVLHCRTRRQAEQLKQVLQERFAACGLELHPLKTRVVYCKNYQCTGKYPTVAFDFLGYTFRPRGAERKDGKGLFTGFLPAISNKAAKAIRQEVRSWSLQNKSSKSLYDLARMFNASIRGWIAYYGRFYRSALNPVWKHLNYKLVLWAARKFKRFRGHRRRAERWLLDVAQRQPDLFAHWRLFYGSKLAG